MGETAPRRRQGAGGLSLTMGKRVSKVLLRCFWFQSAITVTGSVLVGALCFLPGSEGVSAETSSEGYPIAVTLKIGGVQKNLRSWVGSDFRKLKWLSSVEKDPGTGDRVSWRGIVMGDLTEKSLEGLPADQKAQVDLVLLKTKGGRTGLMPRAYLKQYPVLLSSKKNSKDLGSWHSVMPWTSKTKILKEGAPLEALFLSDVTELQLTNFRDEYPTVFLKMRTDPVAMRGEKLFVVSCLVCHAMGNGPSMNEISGVEPLNRLSRNGHPVIKGTPAMGDREKRSLATYLEKFREQNGVVVQPKVTGTAASSVSGG